MILHGYWRSSAAYRVRIALNLKGVAYRQKSHDLRSGEQHSSSYRSIAAHGFVPALEVDGAILIESPAILEYIETRWSDPPLLPADPVDAAVVRAMVGIVACDIHPLNNLRVLNALRSDFGATQKQVVQWVGRWVCAGFDALETMVARHGGIHAFGDTPTLADCCIVPQIYNAQRFAVPLDDYPRLMAAAQATLAIPAVGQAHPDRQPDAD